MGRAVVDGGRGLLAVIVGLVVNAQLFCQLLQLTVAASDTGETFSLMVGQKKLESLFAGFQHLGAVGPHFHSVIDGVDAGSHQASGAFYLHHADTACADLIDFL